MIVPGCWTAPLRCCRSRTMRISTGVLILVAFGVTTEVASLPDASYTLALYPVADRKGKKVDSYSVALTSYTAPWDIQCGPCRNSHESYHSLHSLSFTSSGAPLKVRFYKYWNCKTILNGTYTTSKDKYGFLDKFVDNVPKGLLDFLSDTRLLLNAFRR
ncbi:hypothetical protein BV22DRAFT_853409 [Leucogyrophana mollusca]|uniref:Uncharacterized protein n=1 Tax=Leucogyrophana mollusca TaxID=85980 RepID=A0ACB8B347_9AGAM|nr:hypothetical protein BV22DRAFT_853409 [Leucogyrophana mollusca]